MTEEELRRVVLEEIAAIAPDAALDGLSPTADLREALDLDSIDILNLLIALHRRLGVEIPDADAIRLVTLAGAAEYLAGRLPAGPG